MNEVRFPGRLLIRQRVITTYRAELFGLLAKYCDQLVVISGKPGAQEGIAIANSISPGQSIPVTNHELGYGNFQVYWQGNLMNHVDRFRPDAIVTEANPRFLDTRHLRKWASQHGIPLIGWGLGTTNFFNRRFPAIRAWRQRKTLQLFDSIIAYSELAGRQYAETGFEKNRIYVAHNATVRRRPLPDKNKAQGEPFRVVTFGRLVKHKNIELLINAVAKLRDDPLKIRLDIIGDGPHREELESLANSTGIDCVFHGMQTGQNLASIAGQCDLFVLPGLGGLAIQEAMAMGLPVVVSEADGTELDLVRDENGWRIPVNDLDALTDTIRRAANNPSATRAKGIESYRIFDKEINLETMAEKFLSAVSASCKHLANVGGHAACVSADLNRPN